MIQYRPHYSEAGSSANHRLHRRDNSSGQGERASYMKAYLSMQNTGFPESSILRGAWVHLSGDTEKGPKKSCRYVSSNYTETKGKALGSHWPY